ncbi:MAG: hypothetical protein ACRELU_14045, partial [Gemmatimonadota bacterium]
MVFKDAIITPEEMPRTTPVPEQHGQPHPTGTVPGAPTAAHPATTRAGRVSIERFAGEELDELTEDPLAEELMVINIGPSHPAMHGTFRIKCWLDGETIVKAIPEIGYLHRCFE